MMACVITHAGMRLTDASPTGVRLALVPRAGVPGQFLVVSPNHVAFWWVLQQELVLFERVQTSQEMAVEELVQEV